MQMLGYSSIYSDKQFFINGEVFLPHLNWGSAPYVYKPRIREYIHLEVGEAACYIDTPCTIEYPDTVAITTSKHTFAPYSHHWMMKLKPKESKLGYLCLWIIPINAHEIFEFRTQYECGELL